jgi:hypothetical protein
MITTKQYRALIAKVNKNQGLSLREISQMEVYQFCLNPPNEAMVFVNRIPVSAGVVGPEVVISTLFGHQLGRGKLGRIYHCGNSRRYPLDFLGINGYKYKGVYYARADYAKVKLTKPS